MNRTLRESVIGAARNAPLNHRLSLSLNGVPNAKDSTDENLDLFSKSRPSLSVASTDESDVPVKLGRLSLGSAKQGKSGLDDLLSSAEGGKHDYDCRPSTPTNRSSSIARPLTPSACPTVSRSATPSKPRPSRSTSSMDKARPSQDSRPSTPNSRTQLSTNLNSAAARTTSRPLTPTRRHSTPSLSPVSGPSTPDGRSLSNGRNVASASHPSSPGLRVRAPPQPIVLDFPLETPLNLRTSLPDRPISAGRSRPGMAFTGKGNVEPTANTAAVRRQSSPMVTRGRLAEPTEKGRTLGNGNLTDVVDSRRELLMRKPAKTSTDSTGFGRTISKKSLDMAIRHMDIKNGISGFRSLTGSNLFPQSIRSANQKIQPGTASANGSLSISSNGAIAENVYRFSGSEGEEDKSQCSAKLNNVDIYESSRYETILLKEDTNNTNWLHSPDDKSDRGPIFDHGFELLPEPFDHL
ncbi:hypothetical protein OROGR_024302 [Orobanche gracilis]